MTDEATNADVKPFIEDIVPKPPVCLYRTSDNVDARTLTIKGRNFSRLTLQFQNVATRETSIHFGMEVDWNSDIEIRVDIARIKHLLWPNAKLSLQARLCTGFNYHPASNWSPIFIVADDDEACAVAPMTTVDAQANPFYLSAAVEVLGSLGDTRAIEPLLALLNGNDSTVRSAAVSALSKIDDERIIDPLVFALGDPDYQVRQAAIQGLTQVGYRFREVVFARLLDIVKTAI